MEERRKLFGVILVTTVAFALLLAGLLGLSAAVKKSLPGRIEAALDKGDTQRAEKLIARLEARPPPCSRAGNSARPPRTSPHSAATRARKRAIARRFTVSRRRSWPRANTTRRRGASIRWALTVTRPRWLCARRSGRPMRSPRKGSFTTLSCCCTGWATRTGRASARSRSPSGSAAARISRPRSASRKTSRARSLPAERNCKSAVRRCRGGSSASGFTTRSRSGATARYSPAETTASASAKRSPGAASRRSAPERTTRPRSSATAGSSPSDGTTRASAKQKNGATSSPSRRRTTPPSV